ncbi:peptide chain release factor 3 [Leptospira sp. GIMC2001]|uniref:peptide chain release factor 3 n=1 Tax=Leptospira sp. GIMC2001 TaxID=1513297 RepID=UPI00234B265B|nr:peptide chain release factor 3 [Leptospira sp. GIMC2001]WCL48043.1 peptide chain release factor 3 [Leptospira sp. GIMC2001]
MNPALLRKEVQRRRTFAIIAHPDAGKTTLTEKLLLYGGAIQLAGMVKAKKDRKTATSDWMAMEKERGISISSAALQFEYKDHVLNLLDTPGHEDFSEDTYRTLMAADTGVMVLDAGKGVEAQTIKLFKVCRDRGIPILTFINKMDRPTKDMFVLLDEIEKVLGINAIPLVWPLGTGPDFKGVYSLAEKTLYLFDKTPSGSKKPSFKISGAMDKTLDENYDADIVQRFREDIELIEEGLTGFKKQEFLNGQCSPVFFGSAVNNFGIELFLNEFLDLAPAPDHLPLLDGNLLDPVESPFSAFVFKVQANMNRMHRDRIAFIRVTSGVFERGIQAIHNRLDKPVKLASSFAFFGQDRNTVDIAYPGDIIGVINPGTFQIGDILSEGKAPDLRPLPVFAPEIFATLSCKDTQSLKGFKKGLEQLAEEGILHLFQSKTIGSGSPIVGAMGRMQFEVFQRRLTDEYKVETNLNPLPYQVSRWVTDSDIAKLPSNVNLATDKNGISALLFETEWDMNYFSKNHPDIRLKEHPSQV